MPEASFDLDAVVDAVEWQMAVLDDAGRIVRVNGAWRAFAAENSPGGEPEVSFVGANYLDVCRATPESEGFSGARAAEGLEAVLAGERGVFRMEYPCHAPDRKRWFLMSASSLGGEAGGAVVTHIDITERKTAEDEKAYLALHDPLTDLPNRRLFTDRLRRALARERRGQGRTAVAYLDLDDFKRVNDSLGHGAGDEILRRAADRIDEAVREGDTAARLGGDEFGIVLTGVADAGAAEAAARRIVDALEDPVEYEGQRISVRASVGVAIGGAQGQEPDDLLRRADRAMYRAKEGGRRTAMAAGPSPTA